MADLGIYCIACKAGYVYPGCGKAPRMPWLCPQCQGTPAAEEALAGYQERKKQRNINPRPPIVNKRGERAVLAEDGFTYLHPRDPEVEVVGPDCKLYDRESGERVIDLKRLPKRVRHVRGDFYKGSRRPKLNPSMGVEGLNEIKRRAHYPSGELPAGDERPLEKKPTKEDD